jgi:hypothetical protein
MEVKLMFRCHQVFASSADGDEIFFGVRQVEFEDGEAWQHFELIDKKAHIEIPERHEANPNNPWKPRPVEDSEKEAEITAWRHQAQQTFHMRPRPCYSVGPKPPSSCPEYVSASASASRQPFTTINEEEDSSDDSEDQWTFETVDDDSNMDVDSASEDNNSKSSSKCSAAETFISKASSKYGGAETIISMRQKSVATKHSVSAKVAAAMKAKLQEASTPPRTNKSMYDKVAQSSSSAKSAVVYGTPRTVAGGKESVVGAKSVSAKSDVQSPIIHRLHNQYRLATAAVESKQCQNVHKWEDRKSHEEIIKELTEKAKAAVLEAKAAKVPPASPDPNPVNKVLGKHPTSSKSPRRTKKKAGYLINSCCSQCITTTSCNCFQAIQTQRGCCSQSTTTTTCRSCFQKI